MESPTILVVDDEEDIRSSVAELLSGVGYRVETASDGADALRRMRARRPDLVLLDLMMPGMDGLELLQRQAKEPALATVPVVVATASASHRQLPAVSAILYKPFGVEALRETVARVLIRSRPTV